MKFFIAILGLTTIYMAAQRVASEDSSEDAPLQAYDYTLRVSIVTEEDIANTVIDTSGWSSDKTVVYNRQVNKANPVYLVGNVLNNQDNRVFAVFPTQNILFPCADDEAGSWESVMVKTILQSLTPNGACPIEPGKYTLDPSQTFNVSATFRDILDCGRYEINLGLIDQEYKDIVQVKYTFDTDDLPSSAICK